MNKGYIYLLREREFVRLDEHTYKIGKTEQSQFNRFKQYPNDSQLLIHIASQNCHEDEKTLITMFKSKYEFKRNYGYEYFEGDYREMLKDITHVVTSTFTSIPESEYLETKKEVPFCDFIESDSDYDSFRPSTSKSNFITKALAQPNTLIYQYYKHLFILRRYFLNGEAYLTFEQVRYDHLNQIALSLLGQVKNVDIVTCQYGELLYEDEYKRSILNIQNQPNDFWYIDKSHCHCYKEHNDLLTRWLLTELCDNDAQKYGWIKNYISHAIHTKNFKPKVWPFITSKTDISNILHSLFLTLCGSSYVSISGYSHCERPSLYMMDKMRGRKVAVIDMGDPDDTLVDFKTLITKDSLSYGEGLILPNRVAGFVISENEIPDIYQKWETFVPFKINSHVLCDEVNLLDCFCIHHYFKDYDKRYDFDTFLKSNKERTVMYKAFLISILMSWDKLEMYKIGQGFVMRSLYLCELWEKFAKASYTKNDLYEEMFQLGLFTKKWVYDLNQGGYKKVSCLLLNDKMTLLGKI